MGTDKKNVRELEYLAWSGRASDLRSAVSSIGSLEQADKQSVAGLAMLAAKNGYAECLGILLGAGVRPGRADEMGMTECMWAARRGDAKILSMLLSVGADIEAKDNRGRGLMWHAESYARACSVRPDSGACAAMVAAERERRALEGLADNSAGKRSGLRI